MLRPPPRLAFSMPRIAPVGARQRVIRGITFSGRSRCLGSHSEAAAVPLPAPDALLSELRAHIKRHNLQVSGNVGGVGGRTKEHIYQEIVEESRQRNRILASEVLAGLSATSVPEQLQNDEAMLQEDEDGPAVEGSEEGSGVLAFDAAHNFAMVPLKQLVHEGREGDAFSSPSLQPSDDTQSLLDTLRDDLVESLPADRSLLTDIVLDLGRQPCAWVGGQRHQLGDDGRFVQQQDLDRVLASCGPLGDDNRSGFDSHLHRISALRNRAKAIVGLTLRVGRHVPGNAMMLADLLIGTSKSILILGAPGCGKTTIVREAARMLAQRANVVVVDTSAEIAGPGDVPHGCIGLARRVLVPGLDAQSRVMVECVQNHTPSVLVVDEIGRAAEVDAARTCKERGVRVLASAHGDLASLVRNEALQGLIGDIGVVTVGDVAARKEGKRKGGGMQKTRHERLKPPIFDVVVELRRDDLHHWCLVHDVARGVDSILRDGQYVVQWRRRNPEAGGVWATDDVVKVTAPSGAGSQAATASVGPPNTDASAVHGPPESVDMTREATKTTCPQCGKRFKTVQGMESHLRAKKPCNIVFEEYIRLGAEDFWRSR